MVDNTLAAQLLFQHKLATQEQILSVWAQITPEKNIALLLVEKGLLEKQTYDQLIQHLQGTETKIKKEETKVISVSPSVNPTEPPSVKPPVRDPGKLDISLSLKEMLTHARSQSFSDLHLSAGNPIHVRRGGLLEPASQGILDREIMTRLLREALGYDYEAFDSRGDFESVLDWGSLGRFRIAALKQRAGHDLTIRLIPQRIRNFEESGLPESCRDLCSWAQGLVLVTGPAGCGKTSTLATMVDLVNQSRKDHIITIEEPIEIIYTPSGCQITQRQVGRHTKSREAALRAALREDPDIIVISELRDLDTIQLAVSAAETGHLVFGTMNTINATRTIYRIIDSFPPEEQGIIRSMVSESLRGVISQQLLPRKDGHGVVPAYEVLVVNSAVANMIRKDEAHQLGTAMITGKGSGMVILDDSLRKLIETGQIEAEEAWSRATNPKDFEKFMARR
jgi:twitching motility protein PilT